jgi:hypothetical protein
MVASFGGASEETDTSKVTQGIHNRETSHEYAMVK